MQPGLQPLRLGKHGLPSIATTATQQVYEGYCCPAALLAAPVHVRRFEVELQSLRMRLAAEHQMQLDRADTDGRRAALPWGLIL